MELEDVRVMLAQDGSCHRQHATSVYWLFLDPPGDLKGSTQDIITFPSGLSINTHVPVAGTDVIEL